ncbi:MAG: YHS domain-containing protein [Verrucomicrobiales bacterium]|jgi:YHS domain-containing protein
MTLSKTIPIATIGSSILVLFAAIAVGLTLSSCETTTTGSGGHGHGHGGHNHTHAPANETAKPAGEEKLCPVSGEVIENAYVLDYQGQKIEFCCKQCGKEFLKNPSAYLGGNAS